MNAWGGRHWRPNREHYMHVAKIDILYTTTNIDLVVSSQKNIKREKAGEDIPSCFACAVLRRAVLYMHVYIDAREKIQR